MLAIIIRIVFLKLFYDFALFFQEVPKTPDFAPSRTFYLYTVNQLPTARMLLQNCYKVERSNGIM